MIVPLVKVAVKILLVLEKDRGSSIIQILRDRTKKNFLLSKTLEIKSMLDIEYKIRTLFILNGFY